MKKGRLKQLFLFFFVLSLFIAFCPRPAQAIEDNFFPASRLPDYLTGDGRFVLKDEKFIIFELPPIIYPEPALPNPEKTKNLAGNTSQVNLQNKVSVVKSIRLGDGQLVQLFTQYANQYHIDRQLLVKIAYCEAHFNPQAINGPYGGMFQFLPLTWIANRKLMGLDTNPDLRFNPEEAIKTAAFKISRDGAGAWPVCSR